MENEIIPVVEQIQLKIEPSDLRLLFIRIQKCGLKFYEQHGINFTTTTNMRVYHGYNKIIENPNTYQQKISKSESGEVLIFSFDKEDAPELLNDIGGGIIFSIQNLVEDGIYEVYDYNILYCKSGVFNITYDFLRALKETEVSNKNLKITNYFKPKTNQVPVMYTAKIVKKPTRKTPLMHPEQQFPTIPEVNLFLAALTAFVEISIARKPDILMNMSPLAILFAPFTSLQKNFLGNKLKNAIVLQEMND
jgi:hypothetical protein